MSLTLKVKKFSSGHSYLQGKQLCKIILKSKHKCWSYGPDKLNLWPFHHLTFNMTLIFNLPKQMFKWPYYFSRRTRAQLFWNPCMNVEVMAHTSSIYDHLIIWPLSVTLAVNLPKQILKQMFQMALLLLKENTCAKLFWNPCINVEVMDRTISIYGHFIIWPSVVTLTFNLPKQMFQMAYYSSRRTTVPNYFESMHKCRRYGHDKLIYASLKCDLDLQPT